MAKIIDPDLLADSAADDNSTEVYINTSTKKVKLVVVGDLSNTGVQNENGVTLKALYSFLKEEWKNDPNSKNLAAYPFPMVPITDESFEFVDGWDLQDDTARYLIRDAGWAVKNTSGNVTQLWAGIIGLGAIETDDQLYYQQEAAGAPVNVQLTGQINQAVQIFRDDDGDGNTAEGSDFDRRTVFNLFGREYQQLYGKSSLSDIGVTTMSSIAYRFPITTGGDTLKITANDATVAASSPYTEIEIQWLAGTYNRDVDSATDRNFGIVIDVGTYSQSQGASNTSTLFTSASYPGHLTLSDYTGGTLIIHEGTDQGTHTISGTPVDNAGTLEITLTGALTATESNLSFTMQRATPVTATAEQIYTKVQYQLRQSGDVDASSGSVTGKTADELLSFVGDTLLCGADTPSNPNGGGSGVIIEGFSSNDTNRLTFYDNSSTARNYPFTASLTINFGSNLEADAASEYWIYYTYTHRVTGTDIAVTSASGTTCTLTSSSTSFVEIADNEEFLVSGFADPANNGLYRATAAGGATSITVEKANSNDSAFVNESAGATVNLDMNPYGSASAILVDDFSGSDIVGSANTSSVTRTFDYDNNVQGGRASAVTPNITAVGLGLNTGQYVKATGTIARSTTNSISLVAALERNYANP